MKNVCLTKLYVLLWKNLILSKRQYIITTFQMLLPTLIVFSCAWFYKILLPKPRESKPESNAYGHTEEALASNVTSMLSSICNNKHVATIGFVPKSDIVLNLVRKMEEQDAFLIAKSRCDRTNVLFNGFNSEEEMEAFQSNSSAKDNMLKFAFGIVFQEFTKIVTYKIRIPNSDFGDTSNLMAYADQLGPGGESKYFASPFLGIQILLDKALINYFAGKDPQYTISVLQFPYPKYTVRSKLTQFLTGLPIFVAFGFMLIVPTIIRGIVSEKETGIKELMKMSGLSEWMHCLVWMLHGLMILTVAVTFSTVILFLELNSTTGALFEQSDPTLLWVILMLYAVWTTTYCFAMSAFFGKSTTATKVGVLVWMTSAVLAVVMDFLYGTSFSLSVKLMLCLLPNFGMVFTLKAYSVFELIATGARWESMAGPSLSSVTLRCTFLMMFVSIFLNLIIYLYFEAILPKKFGIRKPFNFIFKPSEWGFRPKTAKIGEGQVTDNIGKPGFEDEASGSEVGVKIVNLRKQFGKSKVAVNNLTMNIFKGQIFCLLGENGAGKTTTMSILTGLFSPTSGTAFINGLDIRADMAKIRQSLGLCPQHNMLFDRLTVLEHLKFFGMLKGLSAKNANVEAFQILQAMKIAEMGNVLAVKLSGGQKRKLSLACSLVGGTKILFLDEPTSGMDPEARRAIWDVLLHIRKDRLIVLTTHYMEEADVLGDRIAIMSSGVLQCCGSPSYLKRFYGIGFVLSMTVRETADRDTILKTVRKHIPDADFKVLHSNTATELSVVLPSENKTSNFPALFSELTHRQNDMGVDGIGVEWATMDEVFVRVEELSNPEKNQETDDGQISVVSVNNQSIKVRGFSLLLGQTYGLLIKKIVWAYRKKGSIVFQMLSPVLLTIAVVAMSRLILEYEFKEIRSASLQFSLASYDGPITLYSSTNTKIGKAYAAAVGASAKRVDNNDVSKALLDVGRKDVMYLRDRHIIAGEISAFHMKAMYSKIAPHSAPLSINMMTNAMLREAVGEGYKLETINHPFNRKNTENNIPIGYVPGVNFYALGISAVFGCFMPITVALLAAAFISAPAEERLCNAKQLQIMTGASPMLYWGSICVFDYLIMFITICLMTACLPIFENFNMFTNNSGAGIFLFILAEYGIAALLFGYILSTFVRSSDGGFNFVLTLHLVTGFLGAISIAYESSLGTSNPTIFLQMLGSWFPSFSATRALIQFAYDAIDNSKCNSLSQKMLSQICVSNFDTSLRECCISYKPTAYIKWKRPQLYSSFYIELAKSRPDLKPISMVYVPAIGQDLLCLALIPLIYLVILVVIEYKLITRVSKIAIGFQRNVTDPDVLQESDRVRDLVAQGQINQDAIVVDNLCKSFESFSAVSSLTFGVHYGECFGLLGVNGAGKTTTFRMLTGDESRSFGNSYMQNLSLLRGKRQFLSRLGYCPQFDGFVGVLTGREMLSLFARLRGISHKNVKKETEKWLRKTGLTKSGDVQCEKYSGGMKRRLNAAMALIGDPPVILFDEPTSGVDPVSRRQFWKIITSITNCGQSVILTSHSMEECEALCARIGIMVNGEMQCLGGVQHLKNKFAQGYSLTIKLKQEHYNNTEMTEKLVNDVLNIFDPCALKDHHQVTMKFQIHSQARSWEDLYRTMEDIKEHNIECIEEYAITATTLEDIFLAFAKTQRAVLRANDDGRCCKCTC